MYIYFLRLKVGWPDTQKAPDDWNGCWRVYTVCSACSRNSCMTRADVAELERGDKIDARTTYTTLLQRAHTGQPLASLYDEKQCHETHSFKWKPHDQTEEKVFRIWGTGDIRVNFVYLPDKRIVIIKTWPKRRDKLTVGEKELLEQLAKNVFDTYENFDFQSRELKWP